MPPLAPITVPPELLPWLVVLGAVGTGIGFVLATIAEWFRAKWQTDREREARELARQRLVDDRRADLQRETLLALQEAMQALVRTIGQIQHANEMEYRGTGRWGNGLLPEDLSDRNLAAGQSVSKLRQRVLDDELRARLEQFLQAAAAIGLTHDEAEGQTAFYRVVTAQERVTTRLGEVLRSLY